MERFRLPWIVINLKVYPESMGEKGVELCRKWEKVAERFPGTVFVASSPVDLRLLSSSTTLPILSQHADGNPPGPFTGSIPAESLLAAGACGTLLNHAEKRVPPSEIPKIVERLRRAGLLSILCTASDKETGWGAAHHPTCVALEPPELIGGDLSVTRADPEVVRRGVKEAQSSSPGIVVLCGAGVKSGRDVEEAIRLGCSGVLVSSGVVLSKDPSRSLEDLLQGASSYPLRGASSGSGPPR